MQGELSDVHRRKVLSTTAAGIGATLFSTVGAADEDDRRAAEARARRSTRPSPGGAEGAVALEDGKLALDLSRSERRRAEMASRAANRAGRDAADPQAAEAAIEDLNAAVEEGYLDAYEQDGEVYIEPTEEGEAEAQRLALEAAAEADLETSSGTSENTAMALSHNSCSENKSDLEFWTTSYSQYVGIWLNNEHTKELATMLGAGATASAVSSAIIVWTGVGAVPAAVGTLIAALFTHYTLELMLYNEGCGVYIEIQMLGAAPIPFYEMESQH